MPRRTPFSVSTIVLLQVRNTATHELKHHQRASLIMTLYHNLGVSQLITGPHEGCPGAVRQDRP